MVEAPAGLRFVHPWAALRCHFYSAVAAQGLMGAADNGVQNTTSDDDEYTRRGGVAAINSSDWRGSDSAGSIRSSS